jgi:hypothetical protein
MFNFDEFLSVSNFVWRALLNKAAIYGVKKTASSLESHEEINIPVKYLNKSV